MYRYEREIRDLILKAKVDNDLMTVHWITSEVVSSPKFHELARWADVIIPAPSSFKSRLRGKVDVPGIIAEHSKNVFSYNYLPAPWPLSWRLYKQSTRSRAERQVTKTSAGWTSKIRNRVELRSKNHYKIHSKYLLIDDIITSGETLKAMCHWLGPGEFKFFVFADAR